MTSRAQVVAALGCRNFAGHGALPPKQRFPGDLWSSSPGAAVEPGSLATAVVPAPALHEGLLRVGSLRLAATRRGGGRLPPSGAKTQVMESSWVYSMLMRRTECRIESAWVRDVHDVFDSAHDPQSGVLEEISETMVLWGGDDGSLGIKAEPLSSCLPCRFTMEPLDETLLR